MKTKYIPRHEQSRDFTRGNCLSTFYFVKNKESCNWDAFMAFLVSNNRICLKSTPSIESQMIVVLKLVYLTLATLFWSNWF